MSEPALEPGPWIAIEQVPTATVTAFKRRHWKIGSESTGKGIAIVFGDDDGHAKLFAAALDLLELARQYASECGECNGLGYTLGATAEHVDCPDCEGIRAVIAKAEGRAA